MGLIRFLLAAAVVLGHSNGWRGYEGPHLLAGTISPYHAVQCFFVISGFYMGMVGEKFSGYTFEFYVCRYSRLLAGYWIVGAATLLLILISPENKLPVTGNLQHISMNLETISLMATNALILGQDLVAFFSPSGMDWMLFPQGWSLGTELWFYLILPFLVPMKSRSLIIIVIVALIARIIIVVHGAPFFPWQQRFFPIEIAFFVAGMLSFRLYRHVADMRPPIGRCVCLVAYFLAIAVLMESGNTEFGQSNSPLASMLLGLFMFLVLPAVFHITRRSSVDRFVGEFSYPIYLLHISIGYFFEPTQRVWNGGLLLLCSVILATPIVLLVERPMNRWRERYLAMARRQRQKNMAEADSLAA